MTVTDPLADAHFIESEAVNYREVALVPMTAAAAVDLFKGDGQDGWFLSYTEKFGSPARFDVWRRNEPGQKDGSQQTRVVVYFDDSRYAMVTQIIPNALWSRLFVDNMRRTMGRGIR